MLKSVFIFIIIFCLHIFLYKSHHCIVRHSFNFILLMQSFDTYYRDVLIVTTLDTFTSLLAGITIFGILGNLAHNLGLEDIKSVVKSGTGLAFISYPDAISKFDFFPQGFAVLFFFMLFTLGIGSVVGLQNCLVTVVCDQFPGLKYGRVAAVASLLGFLGGLVYLTPVIFTPRFSRELLLIIYFESTGRSMDGHVGGQLRWYYVALPFGNIRIGRHLLDLW